MDRNEQNLRIEALRAAVHQHDYEKAMEIADDFDLRKIRDNNLLSLLADVYRWNHEYDKSKDALLTAYENTNSGRQLAYRLCLISIKTKEYDDAEEFYEDFVEMAPRDSSRYILKYKMAKAKNEPLEKQIEILEEYVNIDMEEKWAYELAKLYHLAGNKSKCVDLCDEISLWFAEGKYVLKALELKRIYEPLSSTQQQRYTEGKQKNLENASKQEDKQPSEPDVLTVEKTEEQPSESDVLVAEKKEDYPQDLEEEQVKIEDLDDIIIKNAEDSKFDTIEIQAVVAEGMKDLEIEEVNIHEGSDATKVADGTIPFKEIEKANEADQVFKHLGGQVEINLEDIAEPKEVAESPQENVTESEETRESSGENNIESDEVEGAVEVEELKKEENEKKEEHEEVAEPHSLGDVQDILRQLQARGILKAETVQQAVTIIEEAGNEENKEIEKELAKIDEGLDEVEEEPEKPIDLTSTQSLSADVEVISGADWKQDESAEENSEGTLENTEEESEEEDSETSGEETAEEASESFEEEAVEEKETPSFAEEEIIASEEVLEISPEDSVKIEDSEEVKESTEAEEVTESEEPEETEEPTETEGTVKDAGEETSPSEETEAGNTEADIPEEEMRIPEPGVSLSDEEMSVFKNYLNVEGLEESIRETIEDLIVLYSPDGKSTEGNVIILGEAKTGKTTLAIELIKLVNKKRGRRDRKLAKINARALNKRGFRNSLNKLIGCDLIIENAHELGVMTVSEIIDGSGMFTDDMLMVLEGDTQEMQDIIKNTPRISEVFNYLIQIREYDIKEWVKYGKNYAKEQGFVMDELASLAFYKAIDDCFGLNKGIGQDDVERILDDAMDRCSRKLFKQKRNADGLVILMEKNFR